MRTLSDDERWLLTQINLWGSDAYPIRKSGCRWTWGPVRSINGPPAVYKTKRGAVVSFERFIDVLIEASGDEARRRNLALDVARGLNTQTR